MQMLDQLDPSNGDYFLQLSLNRDFASVCPHIDHCLAIDDMRADFVPLAVMLLRLRLIANLMACVLRRMQGVGFRVPHTQTLHCIAALEESRLVSFIRSLPTYSARQHEGRFFL